jgi:hypothetical protein
VNTPSTLATPAECLAAIAAACFSDAPPDWDALAAVDPAALDAALLEHGVLPLFVDRLRPSVAAGAPLRVRLEAAGAALLRADMFREADLRRTLAALDAAGVRPLVMKGAELAYTHYPRPDLRPRSDSDLLVPHDARAAAERVLHDLGYVRQTGVSGDLVSYQAIFVRRHEGAAAHLVDLHWRVANPQRFARLFDHEELWREAVAIPALGSSARGLSARHALLLACVHRIVHHRDADCLIWLDDIHRLSASLSRADWTACTRLAVERQVAGIVLQSLLRTSEWVGPAAPADVLAGLAAAAGQEEETAAYLEPRRRHVSDVLHDLRALPGWSARVQLMREHLMPPAAYMRDVYAPSSRAPLGLLYLRRALRGARRWLVAR